MSQKNQNLDPKQRSFTEILEEIDTYIEDICNDNQAIREELEDLGDTDERNNISFRETS